LPDLCRFSVSVRQSDLGTISGFVKDPSGATIANAKITVRNNRGVERAATTNDSGYFAITNVPAGLYTIVVEAPGSSDMNRGTTNSIPAPLWPSMPRSP